VLVVGGCDEGAPMNGRRVKPSCGDEAQMVRMAPRLVALAHCSGSEPDVLDRRVSARDARPDVLRDASG
jgi:hypothetical protein